MKRKTVFLIYADGTLVMLTGVFSVDTWPLARLVRVTGPFGSTAYSAVGLVEVRVRTQGGKK